MEDMTKKIFVGPTGNFPRGQISDDDHGELRIAISTDYLNRLITITFGTPTKWVSMDVETCKRFTELLIAHSRNLEKQNGT